MNGHIAVVFENRLPPFKACPPPPHTHTHTHTQSAAAPQGFLPRPSNMAHSPAPFRPTTHHHRRHPARPITPSSSLPRHQPGVGGRPADRAASWRGTSHPPRLRGGELAGGEPASTLTHTHTPVVGDAPRTRHIIRPLEAIGRAADTAARRRRTKTRARAKQIHRVSESAASPPSSPRPASPAWSHGPAPAPAPRQGFICG